MSQIKSLVVIRMVVFHLGKNKHFQWTLSIHRKVIGTIAAQLENYCQLPMLHCNQNVLTQGIYWLSTIKFAKFVHSLLCRKQAILILF
jgi:hypothetical protein